MSHPIRECIDCHEQKEIQGQERCGKCYAKYRKSPEYVPKGIGPKPAVTALVVSKPKRKYTARVRPVTVSTDISLHRELYQLKGLMFAVTDFIHGKLGSEELLLLLKENGYDA